MLYHLLYPLRDSAQIFNLFGYLTFRTGGAIFTALILCFLIGQPVIRWLKSKQGAGHPIRDDGPQTHLKKKGTPTMGGLMILLSAFTATLLWARWDQPYMWIVLGVITGFGLIGFVDDFMKLTSRSHIGLSGRARLILQLLIGAAATYAAQLFMPEALKTTLAVPFFKDLLIPLGFVSIIFGALVVTGSANAVNLTDGLDGLAIVPVMIALSCFGLITYLISNAVFANYLQLHLVPKSGELAVLCGALIGGGLGFLWFNAPPAMVFMGDTGSLSMGAALGAISVIAKHEIVLAIIGGLFVVETLSVMIQVTSFKLTGKRVFRMAPLHHHFEQKGWAEPTIVIRFWIIAIILAMVGLSTLKLR